MCLHFRLAGTAPELSSWSHGSQKVHEGYTTFEPAPSLITRRFSPVESDLALEAKDCPERDFGGSADDHVAFGRVRL